MLFDRTYVSAIKGFNPNTVQLAIFGINGKDQYVAEIEWKHIHTSFYEPLKNEVVESSVEDLQILMNNLWDLGIRPDQAKGSAGQLKATEKHLQDMRTIVMNRLKIGE